MMQIDYAPTAVVCKHQDSFIKIDSKQLTALRQVSSPIEKSGRREKSALRGQCAHPPQCSVAIQNDGRVIATSRSVENIIITQTGAGRPGLKPGRIVVTAALIVERGCCDCGLGSL